MTVKVGICGAAGRMGKVVLEACYNVADVDIAAALEVKGSAMIATDAGEQAGIGNIGIPITDDIAKVADRFDVLIDFTLAAAVTKNVEQCRKAGKRMVIGTTGLSEVQKGMINEAARDIAIVLAPNMSIGVNLCLQLLTIAAGAIGKDSDIDIIEAHHRHKKDAPSGTALRMGELVAGVLGRDLEACAKYDHSGERDKNTIGFQTIRAGDLIGEHTVMFTSLGERIEITHRANSRKTFARGAVQAARWLAKKETGLFDMQDVLGFQSGR